MIMNYVKKRVHYTEMPLKRIKSGVRKVRFQKGHVSIFMGTF